MHTVVFLVFRHDILICSPIFCILLHISSILSEHMKIENRPSTLKLGAGSEKLLVVKPPCPLVF